MALEDKIQAAVDRAVEAVCAGHEEELLNVRQQLQQTLDRRTQVPLPLLSFQPSTGHKFMSGPW